MRDEMSEDVDIQVLPAQQYIVEWIPPINDMPPKYVQIISSWGAINHKLDQSIPSFEIKRSLFKSKDTPDIPIPSFIMLIFANEVRLTESGADADDIYYEAVYRPTVGNGKVSSRQGKPGVSEEGSARDL